MDLRDKFRYNFRIYERRWFLMNRVGERFVSLVFTVRDNRVRVLSARYMHGKEVRKYGKRIG